jgi:hypothetical protein
VPATKQLQRTVIRRRVRAAGAVRQLCAYAARDALVRAFFEQWSTEFEAGAGDWALAQIGIGYYDAARVGSNARWLECKPVSRS